MASRPREAVWDYPRPPRLEQTPDRLQVYLTLPSGDKVKLCDSTSAYRVLETSHPPTYYIPQSDCTMDLLRMNVKRSYCEWKGVASYYDVAHPDVAVQSRIWTYLAPTKPFAPIKNHLAFYCKPPFECHVGQEQATEQPGDFYGGWMTSWIDGGSKGVKGAPGTAHY